MITPLGCASARTQAAPPATLNSPSSPDIVVTARRREEKAQDVPIALTAINAKELQTTGDYTLTQFQQLAPSLQVFAVNPRNTNINIRGLGSNVAVAVDGLDNGVGVYVDQVYLGRIGLSAFDLVDLDQVEVLRGPQGTLFGKNTTAGAINITSKVPSFTPEGSAELDFGNYGYHQVRASLSSSLVGETLAFRLSASDTHRDGFITNIHTGQRAQDDDGTTVRGQLLWKPDADISVRLIGDYAREYQHGAVQPIAGVFTSYDDGTPIANNVLQRIARLGYSLVSTNPFDRIVDSDGAYRVKMNQWGATGIVDWTIPGNVVTSVTGYREWNWEPLNDADYLGVPVLNFAHVNDHQRQFSQEVRLTSTGNRKVDYVLGAYYFWQKILGDGLTQYGSAAPSWYLGSASAINVAALSQFSDVSTLNPVTRSAAAFGQATWHATSRLRFTAGLRFTNERKTGTYVQTSFGPTPVGFTPAQVAQISGLRNAFAPSLNYSARRNDNSLGATVNAAYTLSRDALVYATYSRGNQSGGLNLTALPAGVDPNVKPETVDNYEVGLKSEFLEHALTVNVAAFWTDVGDYQSAIASTDTSFGFRQYIANVKKVRSRGAELDTHARLGRLALSASGAYTDARYLNYQDAPCPPEAPNLPSKICDLSGHTLAGSSKYSASASADYSHLLTDRLEAYGRVDYSYKSAYYTVVSNSRFSRVPGYGLTNLRVGLRTPHDRWDLSFWVRNLLDKNYVTFLSPNDTGLITAIVGDPRTFGGTLRATF